MSAPPVKLHYFNAAALAEPLRWMLHFGELKFEDIRFTDWGDFMSKKASFPYGKVPVLEIEGKTLHQTKAIMRYLAKKLNLIGQSEWDALQCDIMVDTVDDLRAALATYFYDRHEAGKAAKKDTLLMHTVPYYVDKFEAHVSSNGGYMVDGKLTWADFYFAGLVDYLNHMAGKDIFDGKPALISLRETVAALNGVKEHIATRPQPLLPPKM